VRDVNGGMDRADGRSSSARLKVIEEESPSQGGMGCARSTALGQGVPGRARRRRRQLSKHTQLTR
jgi:hypothetical protein